MGLITLDQFVELAIASELVSNQRMASLQDEFHATQAHRPGTHPAAQPFAAWLVSQGVLTGWQCTKLLDGKYKGFFLGKYKLLDHLANGKTGARYLAEDMKLHERVEMVVCPPSSHAAYLVIAPGSLLDEDTDGT